jgi:hypothetical protein
LHNHSLNIIFFYLFFDLHRTCLKLCAGQNAKAWLLTYPIIFFFPLLSNVFSTTLHIRLSISHPLVLGVSHYICSQPLDPMGIHLLPCVHGGERTTLHYVGRDVFVAIMKDVKFHVLWEQTHILPPLALKYLHNWVNIVLLIDIVRTLVDVVITDPTRVDLVSRATLSHGVAVTIATQTKDGLYCD